MNYLSKLTISFFFVLAWIIPAFAEDENRIPVKLFGADVIEDYQGCHFALWQNDRDPDVDKFAYIFYAPIPDAEQLPGWIQIGDTVHEFERLDISGNGRELDRHQFFRSFETNITVHLEILEQSDAGDFQEIEEGKLRIFMSNKFPFTNTVKGRMGCPSHIVNEAENSQSVINDTLEGNAISLAQPQNYNSLDAVPTPIIRHIRSTMSDACNLDQVPQYASAYAVSDAMTIWEVPCNLYARNGATVFFSALNENSDFFVPFTFKAVPGLDQNDRFDILNAGIIPETAEITSYNFDSPANDCGIYEKHQIRAVEGEALEMFLVEYREKFDCDGVETEPENFPLVYSAS